MGFAFQAADKKQVVPAQLKYIWKGRPRLNNYRLRFNLWMLNLDIQEKIGKGSSTCRQITLKTEPCW